MGERGGLDGLQHVPSAGSIGCRSPRSESRYAKASRYAGDTLQPGGVRWAIAAELTGFSMSPAAGSDRPQVSRFRQREMRWDFG